MAQEPEQKVALLSTDDKTDIAEIAQTLHEANYLILSSTGTREKIEAGGVPVTDVSGWTGFPPILNHRLVTYSAQIGAGLLANMSDAEHAADMEEHGFRPIDFVYFGLYDFEARIAKIKEGRTPRWEDITENMDVGGPAALCAAAKGARYVVTSPTQALVIAAMLRDGREISVVDLRHMQQIAVEAAINHQARALQAMKRFNEVLV
jgi:phosphoribosylaminoimidazolecarboxamide formyltransferase/IMP cyclohydrolase